MPQGCQPGSELRASMFSESILATRQWERANLKSAQATDTMILFRRGGRFVSMCFVSAEVACGLSNEPQTDMGVSNNHGP